MSERIVRAVFDDEARVLAAVRAVRADGWTIADVFAPYAVHGLDEAMGVRRSRLGVVCFLFGLAGAGSMLWFQHWSSAVDWPLNVGGKPFNSWPAFVPIAFEATILCAGLGVVLALLVRCRLWPGKRAAAPAGATNDRFVVLVRVGSAARDPDALRRMLEDHGALATDAPVREEGHAA